MALIWKPWAAPTAWPSLCGTRPRRVKASGASATAGRSVWVLAPDAAEMIRDAGASEEVMASIAEAVGSGLESFVTALTTGPQYEPGAGCEAVMPKDLQWHDAIIVGYDEDARMVSVIFPQYANLEAEVACDHVRLPELGDGDDACPLCGRDMPVGPYHLFPQSQHARLKKKGTPAKELEAIVLMCAPCRGACKGAEDDATMAAKFSSLSLLQAHPKIKEFAKYAAKQKTTVGMAGAYST